jgi:hypothetical protein
VVGVAVLLTVLAILMLAIMELTRLATGNKDNRDEAASKLGQPTEGEREYVRVEILD